MDIKLFSTLVKDIYSLCLDQKVVRKLLQDIVSYYGCQSVGINIIDKGDLHVVSEAAPEASEDDLQMYAEHFSSLYPHLNKIKSLENEESSSDVYLFENGKLIRLNNIHSLDDVTNSSLTTTSLLFSEDSFFVQIVLQGDIEHPIDHSVLIEGAKLLLPHIHNAFHIFHTIEKCKCCYTGFEQIINHLNSGAILLNGSGMAVYQNRKARQIIASDYGITIISGRIISQTPEKTAQLREIIKSAIRNGKIGNKKAGVMKIHPINSCDRELCVIAVPLHPKIRALLEEEAGVYAALLIGKYDQTSSLDPEILQLLYDLTCSEARLAVAISNGMSLDEYSESTGISLNTARSYLKLIFQKTDTGRQGELIALLKSIPSVPYNIN